MTSGFIFYVSILQRWLPPGSLLSELTPFTAWSPGMWSQHTSSHNQSKHVGRDCFILFYVIAIQGQVNETKWN
jgi:hypothetical protein